MNDDVAELALVPDDERVRVVECGGRGVASARNLGAEVAQADVLVFTDDDTEPASGWLDGVLAASRRDRDAVGFEGPVVTREYDPLYFHAPHAAPGGCCGANVAYRRSVFLELGGFDERFYGWMPEDVEFGTRAKARGRVVYVPDMVVYHPPRPIGLRERMEQASTVEGVWLLFRKHPSLSQWRVPLRWGPVLAEFRRWMRLLTRPNVVRGSPERGAHRRAHAVHHDECRRRRLAAVAGPRCLTCGSHSWCRDRWTTRRFGARPSRRTATSWPRGTRSTVSSSPTRAPSNISVTRHARDSAWSTMASGRNAGPIARPGWPVPSSGLRCGRRRCVCVRWLAEPIDGPRTGTVRATAVASVTNAPAIDVVVPSYGRPDALAALPALVAGANGEAGAGRRGRFAPTTSPTPRSSSVHHIGSRSRSCVSAGSRPPCAPGSRSPTRRWSPSPTTTRRPRPDWVARLAAWFARRGCRCRRRSRRADGPRAGRLEGRRPTPPLGAHDR